MNRNILIADDNKNILKAYKALFKKRNKEVPSGETVEEGFDIKIFENGKLLLEFFTEEFEEGKRYPLCMLDMRMPVMSGLKTAKELRKVDPDVVILIITAYADVSSEGIRESLKENIYYIRKPFDNEEVFCLVDSLVKGWNNNVQLKKYRNRLQQLVEERTEELKKEVDSREEVEKGLLRLFTAIEQTGEGVIITDEHGKIQYVNPAFEKISGYEQMEVVGKTPGILKSGKHDSEFYSSLWKCISGRDVWRGHLINRKKDGTLYEVDASISPAMDGSGSITNYIAVTRDVTDKIRLERQLRQAQKMEAIGTLAGGIAHDFNNIITSVIVFTELALEQKPDEMVQEHLKEVLRAGYRAADLAGQILAFSRQKEQKKQPVEVRLIAKEVLRLIKASLPATIEIKQNIRAPGKTVLADPTSIHQVIMNLCTNAAHAMKEKGGVLKVSLDEISIDEEDLLLSQTLEGGRYIELEVSDTGYGIDPSIIDRIFDPYFTTKNINEGTGLGLAVVHGIIKDCGGTIRVASEPGKGSVFQVYLPEIETVEIEKEALTAVKGGTERILFVDDEKSIVSGVSQMLEALGYTVIATTNSQEAFEMFRRGPEKFDLVITDHTMPGLTGAELAKEIFSVKPGIPVILCTGFSDVINEQKAKSMGIREFFMKPVTKKKLAGVIRNVLNDNRNA